MCEDNEWDVDKHLERFKTICKVNTEAKTYLCIYLFIFYIAFSKINVRRWDYNHFNYVISFTIFKFVKFLNLGYVRREWSIYPLYIWLTSYLSFFFSQFPLFFLITFLFFFPSLFLLLFERTWLIYDYRCLKSSIIFNLGK